MKETSITLAAACLLACMVAQRAPAGNEQDEGEAANGSNRQRELVIVDFNEGMDPSGWNVEDDVVMGGRSRGAFAINEDGHGVFSGDVSLENNGGFSSVQYYFDPVDVSPYRTACLRVKGDGKSYRFLVESERDARHYYVYEFQTTQDWQIIEVPLADMYPVRRGDRLTIPNFPGANLAMVRFLIGNKKAESFRLEIDSIWLK